MARPGMFSCTNSFAGEQWKSEIAKGVMNGVGARLDASPELLFLLRNVEVKDLIARGGSALKLGSGKMAKAKVLGADHIADVFGLETAEPDQPKLPEAKVKLVKRKNVPVAEMARVKPVKAKAQSLKAVAKPVANPPIVKPPIAKPPILRAHKAWQANSKEVKTRPSFEWCDASHSLPHKPCLLHHSSAEGFGGLEFWQAAAAEIKVGGDRIFAECPDDQAVEPARVEMIAA